MKLLRSNYVIYIIGVICVVAVVSCSLIFKYISYYKQFDNEILVDKSEIKNTDNYVMQIKYPLLKNIKINKETELFLKNEKKNFLELAKESKYYNSEFNVNYSYSVLNNLYSIYIKSYYYVDNEYQFKDKIIYYDSKLNKELKIEDLIINNKIFEYLRNECYDYLTLNREKYNIYEDNILKNKLIAVKDNYDSIIFKEDSIEVIFEPHIVSSYDNEIIVNIKYNNIIGYLNSEYFNNYDVSKEIDTDNVIKKYDRIRASKDFENKKLIALTFDDGPSYEKTDKLITELDKRDARVTFFMLGQLAVKQKELVKKVYDYGHTIGSHTYDHKNMKKLDDENLSFEVEYTNEILSDIIGDDIRFIRPPYGSYNQDILNKVNMSFILWNVDTLDWKLRNAEKVRDYIVEHAKDGDIILLHDIHSTSVEGAIMAIDILKDEGFEFVSLDEMMAYRNVNLQYNKAYRFFK